MTKLAEILASEKTPNAAWNTIWEETQKKFKNPTHYFDGHSKSLRMLDENAQNAAVEAQAREEKPVATSVFETLEYALNIWAKAENLQYRKNATNRFASGTVMWKGTALLSEVPIDELLGLEARLMRIKQLYMDMPTLDATKHWQSDPHAGVHMWELTYPEDTTKTDKQVIPITLKEATKEHPAQVQPISKDVVVGKFTLIKRSGAATTAQKADALKLIDELMMEVKQARMRANETKVPEGEIADALMTLLLSPFH